MIHDAEIDLVPLLLLLHPSVVRNVAVLALPTTAAVGVAFFLRIAPQFISRAQSAIRYLRNNP
jgi:hypothetical protein